MTLPDRRCFWLSGGNVRMASNDTGSRARWRQAFRAEWRTVGGLGRTALVGLLLTLAAAVMLGLTLPSQIQDLIVEGRLREVEAVVEDLTRSGVMVHAQHPAISHFDEEVRLRLLGTDTVRVKVWSADGTVLYSDASTLAGRRYRLSPELATAFTGVPVVHVPDLSLPENTFERGFDTLLEYYIPAVDDSGEIIAVFEVYQDAVSLATTVDLIRRAVWVTISVVFGLLVIFTTTLTFTNWQALDRRRRQAEGLLADLAHSQDEERERVIGMLHDDVGQPLYRILYGLQTLGARLDDGDLGVEVKRLDGLGREIDRTLRAELRLLRHHIGGDESLATTLASLVDITRRETDLAVDAYLDPSIEVGPGSRAALVRAAEEGLINARKHARAHHVDISLERRRGRIVLEVADDGVGYRGPEGLGIVTHRQRIEAVGGGLTVSPRGRGTVLSAWVPVQGEE